MKTDLRGASALILGGSLSTAAIAQDIRVGPFLQHAEPTSIWVVWETDDSAPSFVRYGENPNALTRITSGTSFASSGNHRIHQVQLPSLLPDRKYYYQIETSTDSSSVLEFRTPPLPSQEKPFRFVAYSDTQGGPISNKHTEIINDGVIAFVQDNFGPSLADELAFAMQPGDLVSTGSNYSQWKDQYFDEEQNLIQHIPLYPVPGNHEQDAHWFFDYFVLPENGTPGFIEHWWYKDYSNVRIIGLDSNGAYRIQEQLDWLDGVLADAAADDTIDFVFAQLHHPHLSGIWTPGNTPYTGIIVEKLGEFSTTTGKPSVHFFGHTHAYERGQSRDHTHTYLNVASGEGGIDYWGLFSVPVDYPEFQRVFPDWGFVVVDVTAGDDPSFRVRRVSRGNDVVARDNEVMDDFTIRRHNQSPSTPHPIFPADGTINVNADASTLQASAFIDPEDHFHLESHFQLALDEDFLTPVLDEWIRFENWYAPEGATNRDNGYFSINTVEDPDITKVNLGRLEPCTEYFWRVRYRDESLAWSGWSAASSFHTSGVQLGACCDTAGFCVETRELDCIAPNEWHAAIACSEGPCPELATLMFEDFDSVALGPPSFESSSDQTAWTPNAPSGWNVDNSAMPTAGVPEWRGWTFADPEFWAAVAGNQNRDQFTRGTGAIAVADPDEFHDTSKGPGDFDTRMTSPTVPLTGYTPGSLRLIFDSSWRPEVNQTATITAHYDNGSVEILRWTSNGANFKADATNEQVIIDLPEQGGATEVAFEFRLFDAGNNWWWAIDNVRLVGEQTP